MRVGTAVNTVLAELLLTSHVPGTDPSKVKVATGKGGHGTHGRRSDIPVGAFARHEDLPPVARWADRFLRMVAVAQREVGAVRAGATPTEARARAKRDEDRIILEQYVGVDPTDVAYIFRRSTESVQKLRGRRGLDPHTGEPVPNRALTSRDLPETPTTGEE